MAQTGVHEKYSGTKHTRAREKKALPPTLTSAKKTEKKKQPALKTLTQAHYTAEDAEEGDVSRGCRQDDSQKDGGTASQPASQDGEGKEVTDAREAD